MREEKKDILRLQIGAAYVIFVRCMRNVLHSFTQSPVSILTTLLTNSIWTGFQQLLTKPPENDGFQGAYSCRDKSQYTIPAPVMEGVVHARGKLRESKRSETP